jgi:hypothetical protein
MKRSKELINALVEKHNAITNPEISEKLIESIKITPEFGCHQKIVACLVSDILKKLGSEIQVITSDKTLMDLPIGAIVIPISNSNEHNYKIAEPCMQTVDKYRFMRISGSTGNSMKTVDTRLATKDEIRYFFENLIDTDIPYTI